MCNRLSALACLWWLGGGGGGTGGGAAYNMMLRSLIVFSLYGTIHRESRAAGCAWRFGGFLKSPRSAEIVSSPSGLKEEEEQSRAKRLPWNAPDKLYLCPVKSFCSLMHKKSNVQEVKGSNSCLLMWSLPPLPFICICTTLRTFCTNYFGCTS